MKNFIVNNIDFILTLILFIVSLIANFIMRFKQKKIATTAEEETKSKEELRENLKNSINMLIVDAEKLKHFTGEEKKQYVITRALQMASGLMSLNEIDNYIETQVELTDKVNKHQ